MRRTNGSAMARRGFFAILGGSVLAPSWAGGAMSGHPLSRLQGSSREVQTFNVRDYGAKGDGVTDDTTAFQACIRAAERTMSKSSPTDFHFGSTVYVPDGTYAIHDELVVTEGRAVNFLGHGVASLLQWSSPADGKAILRYKSTRYPGGGTSSTPPGQTQNVTIAGIAFGFVAEGRRPRSEGSLPNSIALQLGDPNGVIHSVTVRECYFLRGSRGLVINNEGDEINVIGCHFFNCSKGIETRSAMSDRATSITNLNLIGNHFDQQTDWCVDHSVGGGLRAIANTFQSGQDGIRGLLLERTFAFLILGNYFEFNPVAQGAHISVNPSAAATGSLGGGTIESNFFNGNDSSDVFALRLGRVDGVRIGKNTWYNTKRLIQLDAGCGAVDIDERQSKVGVTTFLLDNRAVKTSTRHQRRVVTITERELEGGFDATKGEIFSVTLTANRVAGAPKGGKAGDSITLVVRQDSSGLHSLVATGLGVSTWSDAGNVAERVSTVRLLHDGTRWMPDGAQAPYFSVATR